MGLFPVTQERLQSFEVGVKATIGTVLISASGYYYDFKDKQIAGRVADETFGVLNRLVNIPESTVKGAEADITWNVTSQAWLRTLVAYTKAEVDGRFDSFGEFGDPIDLDGKEFPYTPDIQLNIQGGIEVPISEDVGLRAIADWAWQSEHEGNITNNPEAVIDSYGLLNASIGLYGIDRGWSGTLWVKNATDKDYPANYDIATGAVSRVMGMPRTYGLTLKYNF